MIEIRKKTRITATIAATAYMAFLVHARIVSICVELGLGGVLYGAKVKGYGNPSSVEDMRPIHETYPIFSAVEEFRAKERGLELTYITGSLTEDVAATLEERLQTLHLGPAINE